jgi:hypothetical protein
VVVEVVVVVVEEVVVVTVEVFVVEEAVVVDVAVGNAVLTVLTKEVEVVIKLADVENRLVKKGVVVVNPNDSTLLLSICFVIICNL